MRIMNHSSFDFKNLSIIAGSILNIFLVQLFGSMHKYKRAEVVYDNLDLVFIIIELATQQDYWQQKLWKDNW